jgi:hypothetical protein
MSSKLVDCGEAMTTTLVLGRPLGADCNIIKLNTDELAALQIADLFYLATKTYRDQGKKSSSRENELENEPLLLQRETRSKARNEVK